MLTDRIRIKKVLATPVNQYRRSDLLQLGGEAVSFLFRSEPPKFYNTLLQANDLKDPTIGGVCRHFYRFQHHFLLWIALLRQQLTSKNIWQVEADQLLLARPMSLESRILREESADAGHAAENHNQNKAAKACDEAEVIPESVVWKCVDAYLDEETSNQGENRASAMKKTQQKARRIMGARDWLRRTTGRGYRTRGCDA